MPSILQFNASLQNLIKKVIFVPLFCPQIELLSIHKKVLSPPLFCGIIAGRNLAKMKPKQGKSLRLKIIILNCSIILVSLALLISFLLFSMSNIIGSYIQEDIDFFLQETVTNLETKALFAEDIILDVRRNSTLLDFFQNYKPNTEEVLQEFRTVANLYSDKNTDLVSSPFLTSVYLLSHNGQVVATHYYQRLFSQELELTSRIINFYAQFKGNGQDVQFFSDEDSIHAFLTVYTNFMQDMGTIAFSFSKDTIFQLMRSTERYSQTFWSLFNKYNYHLIGEEQYVEQDVVHANFLETTPSPLTITMNGQDYRYHTQNLRLGLKVVIAIPENQLMGLIFQTLGSYLIYIIILTVVIVGLSVLLILRLTVPLREIGEKIILVKEGQYDTKLPEYNSREFQEISSVFNQMTERINYLITEVYQKKLLLQDVELKFLQSQMNPHFMFNVLNMIAIKAQLDKNHDIHKMITAFSRLVQATIYRKDREKVSLRQELEYVEFYLFLQCSRYEGSLSYNIRLEDEDLLDCQVPKLCIQFVVENAVVHGFEPKDGSGHVDVLINKRFQNIDILELVVRDDGVGFKEEFFKKDDSDNSPLEFGSKITLPLETSLQEEFSHKHNGVGINNLHQVIQLFYGQEYGLSIYSKPEKGTTVIIRIPQERKASCIE